MRSNKLQKLKKKLQLEIADDKIQIQDINTDKDKIKQNMNKVLVFWLIVIFRLESPF